MALVNSKQQIVVNNGLVQVIDDIGFVVCKGTSIAECLEKLCERLQQEVKADRRTD